MRRLFATVFLSLTLIGCAGTRAAYKEAESPSEYAFVITSHYASLVNEAADLKESGSLVGSELAAVQAADKVAFPLVLKLEGLAKNFEAAQTAENREALQAAVNEAIAAVAGFIRALRAGQPAPIGMVPGTEPPSYSAMANGFLILEGEPS